MSKQVKAGKPFYLQLSHYAPHVPHMGLPETIEKYRNLPRGKKAIDRDYEDPKNMTAGQFRCDWILNYAACLDNLDTSFGMLLDHLKELGIEENTYVIFTSDNGGGFRNNNMMIGAKGDLTEGGIRVPFMVRGPGIEKGAYCKKPIVGWDFLPTFMELAGGYESVQDLPKELDGGSIVPLFMKGDEGVVKRGVEELVFHFPWYNGEPESSIRDGNFKVLKNLDTGKIALYDLSKDIGEQDDLSSKMPERAEALHSRLISYLDQVGAESTTELRTIWIEKVKSFIPPATATVNKLKSAVARGDKSKEVQLAEKVRYLKWLHGELKFTKERLAATAQ